MRSKSTTLPVVPAKSRLTWLMPTLVVLAILLLLSIPFMLVQRGWSTPEKLAGVTAVLAGTLLLLAGIDRCSR